MDPNKDAAAKAVDPSAKLTLDDTFQFSCGPENSCFTECCAKLELPLPPYDALRLRKRLGLSSDEFLEQHTDLVLRTGNGFPQVLLRMRDDEERRCPFVTAEGCTVYEDRPAACRVYPLGRASTSHPMDGSKREFFFVVREDHCRGFEMTRTWTVREWLSDQGLEEYNRMNDLLMELFVARARGKGGAMGDQHMKMFVMSCYNTERFRDFIFNSGFLKKFDISPALKKDLKTDDAKLLEFAFTWLRFAFFQEPVLKVRGGLRAG